MRNRLRRGGFCGYATDESASSGIASRNRCGYATSGGAIAWLRFALLTRRHRRGTVIKGYERWEKAMNGRFWGRLAWAALTLALSVTTVSQPRAANLLEKNFWLSGPRYDRDVPACDYSGALDRIIANFHTKEFRFWNSELRIVGIENIHETAELPWAAQSIPRRFCSGTAVINDGTKHLINYAIEEDTNIIGMGWGVNFCVAGLDRNWAYRPECRAAGP
jgi:hypothetical protein